MKRTHLFAILLGAYLPLASAQESQSLYPKGYLNEPIQYEELDRTIIVSETENNYQITSVGEPTMTYFRTEKENTSNTVIVVCPGGGYERLIYAKEGSEICAMLNDNGIDAVLLKYRVPRRPDREKHAAPLEDVQRAISLVRAAGNDSLRVGVMGFSAGGHLAVMACCAPRSYEPIDQLDSLSCHPDICALIYPAYLAGTTPFALPSEVTVSATTPPTFMVQAQNDKKCIDGGLFYYYALKQEGVPATFHLYNEGGHGYGLRNYGHVINGWDSLFMEWYNRL